MASASTTPVSWTARPMPQQQRPSSEPSLLLHAPLSARAQDVRHVLTRAFKDFFTKDAVSTETIQNLLTSKGSEDEYHERYVDRLKAAYEESERRLGEIAALEKHVMQSQAKAIAAEERHMGHSDAGSLRQLGVPAGGQNYFRSCVDGALLKRHGLIAPDMYSGSEEESVVPPRAAAEPAFMSTTVAFASHVKGQRERKDRAGRSQLRGAAGGGNKGSRAAAGRRSGDPPADNGGDNSYDDDVDVDATLDNSDDELANAAGCRRSTETAGGAGSRTRPAAEQHQWKNQMSAERREKEKELLARLQQRANYLKNPRFDPHGPRLLVAAPASSAGTTSSGGAEQNTPVFVARPSAVLFSEYAAGQVYEATLELKNVSATLQPVRVLPPSTTYFALGLGQFPGEQGLVAAGMSARYKIRFMPDSLGEYQDEIVIQSPGFSQPLRVRIAGRRMPPILTMPSCIDAGHSLVGGARVTRYEVRNEGGPGKFCMMPKSKWPAANFKSSVNPAAVQLPPFQIQPAIFELRQNESCTLTITFRPQQAEVYRQSLVMVCDNCHVKEFTLKGEGQFASVDFLAVDGGTSEPEPGEMSDLTAQKLIRFDDLNPYTFTQKTVVLSNSTQVDLPFEWKLVKPVTELRASIDDVSADSSSTVSSRTLDFTSAFNVHPQAGILPAGEVSKFTLSFAPAEVSSYHGVMHLVLPDIPTRPSVTLPPAGRSSSSLENVAGDWSKEGALGLLTALEIQCKGQCVPLSVQLKPYAVYVDGAFLVGTTTRKHIQVVNNSLSAIVFRWDYPLSEHILEVIPPIGEIGPGGTADLEVTITGCRVGHAEEVIYCYVKYMEQPLALPVHFDVKGPEVVFDEADLNFGLVRFSTSAKSMLHIRNTSEMLVRWSISEKPQTPSELDAAAAAAVDGGNTVAGVPGSQTEFVFTPNEGELKPLGSRAIAVHYYPQTCKSLQTFFQLRVNGGESSRCIAVAAEVQNPDVCFLSCKLDIPKVFLKMPMSQYITIVNKTYLRTQYTFGKPFGSGAELCKIDISSKGEIGPRDQIELELTFTALQPVERITDVRLPCYVMGMDEPLLLLVSANVESLSVTCSVFDSVETRSSTTRSGSDCGMDFGLVDLSRPAKRYLSIRNNTAIPAPYKVAMEYFAGTLPETAVQSQNQQDSSSSKPLLKKTLNIADPASKTKLQTEAELKQTALASGLGMAAVLRPASGVLQAYEETIIEVELYSDMWGQYNDSIICDVGDLKPISIPLRAEVCGVPLLFQMAGSQSMDRDVTLRFGTHASNADAVSRRVRINNISPFDIRLDWQFFSQQDKDEQLLDLVVAYGDPFPLINDGAASTGAASTGAAAKVAAKQRMASSAKEPVVPSSERDSEPLIKLVVGAHQGTRSDRPYSVAPTQMAIAARSHSFATFTFDPLLGDSAGGEFFAYALAFLTIPSKAREIENKVTRRAGYETMQLRLNFTGTIKPAILTAEYDEDDDGGLSYTTAASDLLSPDGSGRSLPAVKKYGSVKLTNRTEAVLRFRLSAPEPFSCEGSSYHASAASGSSDEWLELKPAQSTQVTVSFTVKQALLDLAETLEVSKREGVGLQQTTLCMHDGERQLFFTNKLKIMFSNGALQHLPLRASIVVPSFAASRTSLDFGTCLVGQKKQLTFTLFNRTRSGTVWTANLRPLTAACTHEIFAAAPSSGKLDAHIAHITKSSVVVTVTFAASDAEDYEGNMMIEGRLGEQPLIIHVTGSGSYDERHESLVNLEITPSSG